jgi:beta-N-acetylhexosaminidase
LIDLTIRPFFLDDKGIKWVEETLASLTEDEKIAQLFCLITYSPDEELLKHLARDVKPGGFMCRAMDKESLVKTISTLQENSPLPLLIAANLERGGDGVVLEGSSLGSPMQAAASGSVETARRLGEVCAVEGGACGVNWAFAPIVDIDYNFRNPITNVRTFGSDPDKVSAMGSEFIKAVQKEGMAAAAKHFPGDGVDERDQHLVTTINDLSWEDWDQSYGKVYRACIDAGVMSVMAGHIMLPHWSRKMNPAVNDDELLPATLAPEIIQGLLRKELGFNGLVITDASAMAGMNIPMPRAQAVPAAIAAGCDMFLFTRNMDEDFAYMAAGVREGIITRERLDEAVTRILAAKAALELHKKQKSGDLIPRMEIVNNTLGSEKYQRWAEECADESITLVKNLENILPISPARHERVLLYDIQNTGSFFQEAKTPPFEVFTKLLEAEGFRVDRFDPSRGREGLMRASKEVIDRYDLIIYLASLDTKSNQTVVRIEWAMPLGANVPVYIHSIPTVFISLENPYHLLDVPRVKTYINTYGASNVTLKKLVDKLLGRSDFKGVSPVDPFCGRWDTRL